MRGKLYHTFVLAQSLGWFLVEREQPPPNKIAANVYTVVYTGTHAAPHTRYCRCRHFNTSSSLSPKPILRHPQACLILLTRTEVSNALYVSRCRRRHHRCLRALVELSKLMEEKAKRAKVAAAGGEQEDPELLARIGVVREGIYRRMKLLASWADLDDDQVSFQVIFLSAYLSFFLFICVRIV